MKQFLLAISIVFSVGFISCSDGSKQSNEAAELEDENVPCLCCLEEFAEDSIVCDSIQ